MVGANETAELIKKEGGECLAIKCDVSDVEMITKAATQARNTFGDVTLLINNAGIVSGKSILETTHKEAELILKVNTLSHIYTTKEFLPSMIKNNRGHIVTVASSAGLACAPKLGAYCLSKFALLGFEEALRLELKRQKLNINTTCVCPTLINTGMFKGAGPKYEWLMPPLEEKWISERIVLAIRQNEPLLLTPFISGTIYLTRTLLPTYFLDKYLEFIGVYEYMDGFIGRCKD